MEGDVSMSYQQKSKPIPNLVQKSTPLASFQNYYGNHKKFKTQFRNKRYRNVYNQLINRKPAQQEYLELYCQDLLIAIIKTIQMPVLFVSKENETDQIEDIKPFLHFGKKTITDYYWLFLQERRLIDGDFLVQPHKKYKISFYFTLVIDFSSKMAVYLNKKGDCENAGRIFECCHELVLSKITSSSTSNLRLTYKIVQFLLVYAVYCQGMGHNASALKLFDEALKILLNMLILINLQINRGSEKQGFRSYSKKYSRALNLLVEVLLCLVILKESEGKYQSCKYLISAVMQIEQENKMLSKSIKLLSKKIAKDMDIRREFERQQELQKLCQIVFNLEDLEASIESFKQPKPVFPYGFTVNVSHLDKLYPNSSNVSNENRMAQNFGPEPRNQRRNKEVKFKLANSGVTDKKLRDVSMQIVGSDFLQSRNQLDSIKVLESVKKIGGISLNDIVDQNIANVFLGIEDYRSLVAPKSSVGNLDSITSKKTRIKSYAYASHAKIEGGSLTQHVATPAETSSTLLNQTRRQLRKQRRTFNKISYKNKNYLECQSAQWKEELKKHVRNQGANSHNPLKKKCVKDRVFTFSSKKETRKQSSTGFYNIDVVEQRMLSWHNDAINMDTEIGVKREKLLQMKNQKSWLPIDLAGESHEQINNIAGGFNQCNELKFDPISTCTRNTCCQKVQNNEAVSKKLTGISLLKSILIAHKKQLGISKPEHFAIKEHSESAARRYQPRKGRNYNQLIHDDRTRDSTVIYHDQAAKNINFYMSECEKALGIKSEHILCQNTPKNQNQKRRPRLQEQLSEQELQNFSSWQKMKPYNNLFKSSLNSRADSIDNDFFKYV